MTQNYSFVIPDPPVGYYEFGEVQFHVNKRPNWFQQRMIKWFFGWEWHDG